VPPPTSRSQVAGESGVRFEDVPPGAYSVEAWVPGASKGLILTGNFHKINLGNTFGSPGKVWGKTSAPGAIAARSHLAEQGFPPESLWARQYVDVAPGQATVLELAMAPAARICGRVASTASGASDLAGLTIILRPADGEDFGGLPQPTVEPDLSFCSVGFPPGRYVISARPEDERRAGLYLSSVLAGGRDVLGGLFELGSGDLELQITFSASVGGAVGTVVSPSGKPIEGARALIFPEAAAERDVFFTFPSIRRVVQVQTNDDGAFKVRLPTGRYLAVALQGSVPNEWTAPESLNTLSQLGATSFAVTAGDLAALILRAKTVK
jgi:hypothetical protein